MTFPMLHSLTEEELAAHMQRFSHRLADRHLSPVDGLTYRPTYFVDDLGYVWVKANGEWVAKSPKMLSK